MRTAVQPKHDINSVDRAQLDAFLTKMLGDLGAGMSAALVLIGDELGLYKALANSPTPLTPDELAARTSTDPRYIREWLNAMTASGYVTFDGEKYTLTPEQALTLAWDDSPVHMPGAFQIVSSAIKDQHKVTEAFRSGSGVGWHEHHPSLFEGTERFFRPNYAANLVTSWIPALTDMQAKLERGARVADVGCGHGSSTILMAQAYPNSKFFGFDYHQASIEKARDRAMHAGVGEQIEFKVAFAKDFPGNNYDLVTFFDCLHDMGDPQGAAKHVLSTLAKDGTWMIVEPFAHDDPRENMNPVGRVYYSASTMICTPASRSQEVGACLGAQAGEARIRDIVTAAGFTRFRRAAETPFNLVYEARP